MSTPLAHGKTTAESGKGPLPLILAGAALALISAYIGSNLGRSRDEGMTFMSVPPGPKVTKLELASGSTVKIYVRPDHAGQVRSSTFVTGSKVESHIVLNAPIGYGSIPEFPYSLQLKAEHLALLTNEIAKPDPAEVCLSFPLPAAPPAAPDPVYNYLANAKRTNDSVQFTVTLYCWYDHKNGMEDVRRLSTECSTLRVEGP